MLYMTLLVIEEMQQNDTLLKYIGVGIMLAYKVAYVVITWLA